MPNVRLAVYDHIVSRGRVPAVAELAARLGSSVEQIAHELRELQEIHALALAPGSDEIVMAHPFSAVPTVHVVRTALHAFWANCAWDALSIPAMLGVDGEIDTRCGDCGLPMTFSVKDGQLEPDAAVVHFVVRPSGFWRNIVYT
jgi:hypothetical protein